MKQNFKFILAVYGEKITDVKYMTIYIDGENYEETCKYLLNIFDRAVRVVQGEIVK